MASAVTETRRIPDERSIRTFGTIVLSGSYVTGGEAVAIPKPYTTKNPYFVNLSSKNGGAFQWDYTTNKMKIFSALGTELAAGAYAAGYTGDVINYHAEFPKFG